MRGPRLRWTAEGEELTLFANSKDMRGEQEAANDEVAAFVKLAEERHASAVAAHVSAAGLRGRGADGVALAPRLATTKGRCP